MTQQKPRGVVDPPFIDPNVGMTNPAAMRYARQVQERAGLPKDTTPRGGAPLPAMPRLDSPVIPGATIAQHAPPPAQRAPAAPPSGGIFEPNQLGGLAPAMMNPPAPAASATMPGRPAPGIQHGDLLPEQAMSDPGFISSGQGHMVASNQPQLAYKYGVMRNGQYVPAHIVTGAKAGKLSEETVRQLAEIQEQRMKAAQSPNAFDEEEEESKASPAGAAAGLNSRNEERSRLSPEEQKKVLESLDQFDRNALEEAITRDLINNDEQRQIIEERLEPLDLSSYIMQGFITQRIPVVPGVFEFTLQSYDAQSDLEVKRMITEEVKGSVGQGQYYLDRYSMMTIALGLHSFGHSHMPSHLDNRGYFDKEKFLEKLQLVLRLPFHVIAAIGVHYHWFDIRVRKLVTVQNLKNG